MWPIASQYCTNNRTLYLLISPSKWPEISRINWCNTEATINMQKWLHNTAALQQSHPVWGHRRAAATQAARVETCRTHVGGVDGPQAAEDVMKLWGSGLQVWEVSSPASSQKLLTAELQGNQTLIWWCETFTNVRLLLKLGTKLLNCFTFLCYLYSNRVDGDTKQKSDIMMLKYANVELSSLKMHISQTSDIRESNVFLQGNFGKNLLKLLHKSQNTVNIY